MRRTTRVGFQDGCLRRLDEGNRPWILALRLNRIIGDCDMRWVNMYKYKVTKGVGEVHKIIGDE